MTLKDMMAADAQLGGVFFPVDEDGNPTEFNEIVTYYPEFDVDQAVSVNAVVIRDRLEGTNEVFGDGRTFNRDQGRGVRDSIVLEIPASINVRDVQPTDRPDAFKIGGETWIVKRIIGEDADMQSVLAVKATQQHERMQTRRG